MERIFVKDIKKIQGLRIKLEKSLSVRIAITGTHMEITGKEGYSEYIAAKVIEAIAMGFELDSALKLKSEDYLFERIDIKNYAKPSRVTVIKGRLIGLRGKAKKALERLTDCEIEIKGHYVGILGQSVDVTLAMNAIIKLIQGSPHSKVYAFLERNQRLRSERHEEEEKITEEEEEE